ncbi:hypothetical protein GH714_040985 [Hevea brasiliensis]|uniref:RNase H type-1 domain-containing protein n=1 Tax=Hevea brasiliensis TaxID=3981 RepID=A0A6A6N9Z0_HEVBR|nr:hypothetical protein GH714_040985 [Hevea brasiliensis]
MEATSAAAPELALATASPRCHKAGDAQGYLRQPCKHVQPPCAIQSSRAQPDLLHFSAAGSHYTSNEECRSPDGEPSAHLQQDSSSSFVMALQEECRDHGGYILCVFSCPSRNKDLNIAELLAIAKALELSVQLLDRVGCASSILVELDSKIALSWINNPWRLSSILNCLQILHNVSFIHTLQEANSITDDLDRQGVDQKRFYCLLVIVY